MDVLHINRPSKSGTSYNELRVSAEEEQLCSQVGPKCCTNKQPIQPTYLGKVQIVKSFSRHIL